MKFINENIYWHAIGKISNYLNRLLQEFLGCAATIILIIFFCKAKIFPLLEELPQTPLAIQGHTGDRVPELYSYGQTFQVQQVMYNPCLADS